MHMAFFGINKTFIIAYNQDSHRNLIVKFHDFPWQQYGFSRNTIYQIGKTFKPIYKYQDGIWSAYHPKYVINRFFYLVDWVLNKVVIAGDGCFIW